VGLLVPFPLSGRIWTELFNLAHAPSFMALTLVVAGVLDPPAVGLPQRFPTVLEMSFNRGALLAIVAATLGAGVEFLQRLFGRSASFGDAVANAVGALAAFCWMCSFRAGDSLRLPLRGCSLLLLVAGIWNPLAELQDLRLQVDQFPVLSSLERPRELSIWEATNSVLARTDDWSTDGDWALQVTLQPATFSGAALKWPVSDWRTYDQIHIDVRNAGDESLTVILKITDRRHEQSGFDPADRFERSINVPAGQHRMFDISLTDVRHAPANRDMNLSDVDRVEIFVADAGSPGVLQLDNVRLTRRF
jgi:VanZ family protein